MIFCFILFIIFLIWFRLFYKSFDLFPLIMQPVSLFIGAPGSGKTTLAAALAHYSQSKFAKKRKYSKKFNTNVFCNCDILDTFRIESDYIGKYDIRDGLMLVDEAGIDFNGRNWKSMGQDTIKYLKLVRHYNIRSCWFSQDVDCDATIRRLASTIHIVTKIGPLIRIVPIKIKIAPSEDHKEISKLYYEPDFFMRFFKVKHVWAPSYFKYFDSFDSPELEHKEFEFKSYLKPESKFKIFFKKSVDKLKNIYYIIYIKIKRLYNKIVGRT